MSKRIAFGPIYKPAALAGEYGDWALNIYTGCPHRCTYCYVPGVMHKSREDWQDQLVRPRVTPEQVQRAARSMRENGITGRVFLCFTCDPYGAPQPFDITREVIQAITRENLSVTVLTKAGSVALRDVDLLEASDSDFWVTLTTMDRNKTEQWEPGAAPPWIRLDNLAVAHGLGIPTALSLEPVIWPADALEVIRRAGPYADVVHVGKLNHGMLPAPVDWPQFCRDAKSVAAEVAVPLKFKSSLEAFAS